MTDWSLNEKSLLVSILAMLATAIFYFDEVLALLAVDNRDPGDIAVLAIAALVVLVVVEAVYHAIVAVEGERTTADERDRAIRLRGSRLQRHLLELGVIAVIGHMALASLFAPARVDLFLVGNLLVAVLIVAELAGRGLELWHYRVGFHD